MARPRSRRRRPKPSSSGAAWIIGLVALAAALVGGWLYLKRDSEAKAADKDTGCLKSGQVPEAALFLVDTTDRLTPENAKFVVDSIKQDESVLARFSRVILVPFGDDTAQPLAPIFNKCLPGKGSDAGLDENARLLEAARKDFDRSLEELQDRLVNLPPSKASPITAQVTRAASSNVLGWQGNKRILVVISDGLESSIYWSHDLQLAAPPAHLLDNVDVEYVELGNAKGGHLQTAQMRERWKAWFETAGAKVRMNAPGYAAFSPRPE